MTTVYFMKPQTRLFRLTHVAWLTAMLLFAFNQVMAQCPPGNVILDSQADVNDFLTNYPNCTEISGNLQIGINAGTSDIIDISPLGNLTRVENSLNIWHNSMLPNLSGLNNITSVGGLDILFNSSLGNINGLSNLTSTSGLLQIRVNHVLTDLNGLNNLTIVGGDLNIRENAALTNVSDLSSLTSIPGFLNIEKNAALTNLDGLSSLTSVGGYFNIRENASLTSVNALGALANIGGILQIANNAALTGINGFSSLTNVGGAAVNIVNNGALTNVDGFSSLTSITGYLNFRDNALLTSVNGLSALTNIGGYLRFNNNDQLQSLNGLQNLASIGGALLIQNNDQLTDISAVANIDYTTISFDSLYNAALSITDNTLLSVCNLPNICAYLSNDAGTHPRVITGNLANCVDEAAVVVACSTPTCPPGNVVLTTQAQVDQFIIDYPNCTQIAGYLAIRSEVTNLNALSNIITITGSLDAGNATMLTDISGLSNLTTIGQDALIANSALTDLNGLSSLTNIVGWFSIRNNASLTNINGLGALTNVGGYLIIRDNASLTSVNGLVALANVGGYLQFSNNAALTGINGFNSLTNVGGEGLAIVNNGALTNVEGLSNLTSITGVLNIRDNASLTNVNGLGALVNIGGFLQFVNNAALTNLNGLRSLTNVGGEGVIIINNGALTNLDGLSSLTSITGYLNIRDNVSLTSVNGFSTLTNIGSYLRFYNNDQLQSLNGLQNLASIGGALVIEKNDQLTDISAVANIDYTTISFDSLLNAALSITDNTLLSVCNLPNICAYLSNDASTHPRNITGNLANCLDEAAVVVACSTPDCPAGNVVFSTQAEVDQFLTTYPNCTEITGNLFIGVNSGTSDITNLAPLHNLTHIGGWLAVYTTSLTSLNGLHQLTSISHDIDIRANINLTDVSALQNTTFTPFDGFGLTIINNPALAVCNLSNFCAYIENPASTHPRVISGNLANCLDEAAVVAACVTGIDMIDASLFSVYPNPVNDIVNIVYDKPVTQVSVINMLGQTVLQKDMNTTHASVDIAALPSGSYYIHILTGDAFSTVKVIKQ
jgi:hypothetical protein